MKRIGGEVAVSNRRHSSIRMNWLLWDILATALVSSTCLGNLQYRCPSSVKITGYVHTFHDHCFEFIPRETTWNSASTDCKSRGGHLVVIHDRDTQNFVMSTLKALRWPRKGIWIGATDQESEMQWYWVTGQKVNAGYSNWAPSQPSCHLLCFEDCALLRLDDGGKWHDYHCSWIENYSYICQYDLRPDSSTVQYTSTTTVSTSTIATSMASAATHYESIVNPTPVILSVEKARTFTSASMASVNGSTHQLVLDKAGMQVHLLGDAGMTHADPHDTDIHIGNTGSLVGLVMGILFGLCVGLCLAIFFFAYRRNKPREELPTIVFANPYYGQCGMPLGAVAATAAEGDEDGEECCFMPAAAVAGPIAKGQAGSNTGPQSVWGCRQCSASSPGRTNSLVAVKTEPSRHGDCKAARNRDSTGHREQHIHGRETNRLIDNHYDHTTGENFYESLENVRQTIEQNIHNEHLDCGQRYVPFVFGPHIDR